MVPCEECGEEVQPDPDGSPGVFVHARSLGDFAFDLDEEHAARPDEYAAGLLAEHDEGLHTRRNRHPDCPECEAS